MVSGPLYDLAVLPWERIPTPIEQEAGWIPELVKRFWRQEKSLAQSIVTIQTTLFWLQ
jgi:hypothetical protein